MTKYQIGDVRYSTDCEGKGGNDNRPQKILLSRYTQEKQMGIIGTGKFYRYVIGNQLNQQLLK